MKNKYRIGDRVYCGACAGLIIKINDFGTVVACLNDFQIGVQFDNWREGHSCRGSAELNSGRWIYHDELIPEAIYNSTLYNAMQEDE